MNKKLHRVSYPAPARKSVTTAAGWATEEWQPGEKAAYERSVLNREPSEPYPTGTASLKQLMQPLTPTNS